MKERLTGAVILVAVLVFLVPELLSGPAPKSAPVTQTAEGPPMRSYTIDLADDSRKSGPLLESGEVAESPDGIPAEQIAEPAESGDAAQVETPPVMDEPLPDAPVASPGSTVSTPQDLNAESKGSAPVVKPPVPTTAGPKDSVRVAEATPKKPVAPAPTPARSASAGSGKGFAVQIGSFASRDNAERLAGSLRGKGFAAFVMDGKGTNRKLYRVRVGPEADRAAAQTLANRLRASGQTGSVVPHP